MLSNRSAGLDLFEEFKDSYGLLSDRVRDATSIDQANEISTELADFLKLAIRTDSAFSAGNLELEYQAEIATVKVQ